MTWRQSFAHGTGSVAAARRFVAGCVGDEVAPARREIVVLLVSELATNSVRHAASAFAVEVDLQAGELTVRVTDDGPGLPAVRSTAPQEPTGRGLRVVESLSDDWGIQTTGSGKTVWFRLHVGTETTTGRAVQFGAR